MAGDLPARRIARDALERIIQRAAELQAGEMDTGEGMTEPELLKLGAEVGIDGRFLRQALYEETAGSGPGEKGLIARWFGPGRVSAGRVVPGERANIEQALTHWMAEGEALAVKRRLPDRTVWDRQRGFFAEMKRNFRVGGKQYHLARALDVTVVVTQLEPGFCHVELSADVSLLRSGAVYAGAAGAALALIGASLLAMASNAPLAFDLMALIPIGAAALTPVLAGRMQQRRSDEMQLALEQVLDRLEHGEIKPRHQLASPRASAFVRIADEIRRAVVEASTK